MARYPQGATVTLSFTVKDSTGSLVDASPIALTVHKPDGTVTAGSPYTPAHDGTGLYHQDLPLTDIATVGHYQHSLTATISGKAGVQVGSFDVFDPFEVTVLSLGDAKDMLNIPQSSTTDDAEILRKIATIEANIEKMTGGPVVTRQISNERVRVGTGYRTLTVRYRPLVAVVSIVDVATPTVTLDLSDLDPDYATGVLRRRLQLPFWGVGPFYLVTYTAGLGTAVPAGITEAAAIILDHLWQTQRGQAAAGAPFGGQEVTTLPGFGFAIPNRAAELLSPYALEVFV
jgi:hypothetical protein